MFELCTNMQVQPPIDTISGDLLPCNIIMFVYNTDLLPKVY